MEKRLSSIDESTSKYSDGVQYDLQVPMRVIKYAAKVELKNLELDDFEYDVLITSVNFIQPKRGTSLLDNEDVVMALSSNDTIEQIYEKLKGKIKLICSDFAVYNFNLFLNLLFGDTVITKILTDQKLQVGNFIVIDISGKNKITVEVNTNYRKTYFIYRDTIWFLLKRHRYDLELLEDELNKNDIPFYDIFYTLIYIKAFHDTNLVNNYVF